MENDGMKTRMNDCLNGGMFPAPKEDVEEIIAKENCIDGENVAEEHLEMKVEPISEKDIFMQPKKKKQNIVLKVNDGEINNKNVKITKKKKQRDYSHLAKARAKGAEVRKAKAEARRLKKAEEKAEKDRIKAEKKAATAERNRQRARDRYYKQKEEREQKKKEGKIQKPSPPVQKKEAIPAGMSFEQFANYMLKYENMKKKYKDAIDSQTAAREEKERIKKMEKERSMKKEQYHPANYPLAHLYNPHLRKNKSYF